MSTIRPRPFIRANRLQTRCRQLGRRITEDYAGTDLLVTPLLGGAFCFVADLVRHVDLPDLQIHFARAASYGLDTVSGGAPVLADLPDCADRDVLVVDDILDTGRTLSSVTAALSKAGARSIRSCVLLNKPARRSEPIEADYIGFTIPDRFVVGYGLDHGGRWRHLRDVCTMLEPTT